MKKLLNTILLPCLIGIAGVLGFLLQRQIFQTAIDHKGLLVPWSLPQILVTVLSLAVAVLTALSVWKDRKLAPMEDPRYLAAMKALSGCVFALAIALSMEKGEFALLDNLAKLHRIFGWIAVAGLILSGILHFIGSPMALFPDVLVCLFLGLHLADQYRHWSGNPMLAAYIFPLLACVGMMLTAYHRAAMDAKTDKAFSRQVTCLLGGYFCILSAGTDPKFLYLAGGLWCLCHSLTLSTGEVDAP